MKKAPWLYGIFLGLAVVATARFAPPQRASARVAVAAAPTVDQTWTIPGAGRTAGQNNTQFVSDLALTNLGTATANVTLSFVGPGGLPAKPLTLASGATTVYRNVLDALWSANGLVGALSVHADQPLVLRARTYNTAATGTFGSALPVYSSDHLIGEGQTADSLWVPIMEKVFTFARSNAGTFQSIHGGSGAEPFNALNMSSHGVAFGSGGSLSQNAHQTLVNIKAELDSGYAVVASTPNSNPTNGCPCVKWHLYSVVSVNLATDKITLRNPWATDGGGNSDGANDGYVTFTADQFYGFFDL